MKYFYDTEFLEDGATIDLISIGIVAEDGREYYSINRDADWDRITEDDWLMDNVIPQLPGFDVKTWRFRETIAAEVRDFLLTDGEPELWADYAAYDHVVLCQLFGRMIDLPAGMPMFTHDLQQLLRSEGWSEAPFEQEGTAHDALEDARHLKRVHAYVTAGYTL